MNAIASCKLSGGDTQTLPAVIEKELIFCIHRWQGHKHIMLMPTLSRACLQVFVLF